MPNALVALPAAVVTARLAQQLPGWTLADGCIQRRIATHGWQATLLAANAVGHLAEAAWHHPELRLRYAELEVRLHTHDVQGITEKDLALARKIDEVLLWQPAGDADAGAAALPDDARPGYLVRL